MTQNNLKQLRHKAPDDLRAEMTALVSGQKKRQIVLNIQFGNWLGAAMGTAAVACFIFWASVGHRAGSEELLQHEVVSSHVRSMMDKHLFDVASTDRHTVKPWFNGKLDFSPRVVDLATSGFPLVGGRLDYISGRPVAALIYKSDQHFINLLTWPANGGAIEKITFSTLQGFNLVTWTDDGMKFYAVSDLNANSLRDFAEHLKIK